MEFRHFPQIWEMMGDLHRSALGLILEKPLLILLPLVGSLSLGLSMLLAVVSLGLYAPLFGILGLVSAPPEVMTISAFFFLVFLCHLAIFIHVFCRYLGDSLQLALLSKTLEINPANLGHALSQWPKWSWRVFVWPMPDPPYPIKLLQNTRWQRFQRQELEMLLAFPYWLLEEEDPEQALLSARSEIEANWQGVPYTAQAWVQYFMFGNYLCLAILLTSLMFVESFEAEFVLTFQLIWDSLQAGGGPLFCFGVWVGFCLWMGWGRFVRVVYQLALYAYREGLSEGLSYPDYLPEMFLEPMA